LNESWVIPPEANAGFVCQMEDVLQLYTNVYDPDYPLVCFDESSNNLLQKPGSLYQQNLGSLSVLTMNINVWVLAIFSCFLSL
jgi:hypothetical protein